jgi:hypothetical protein
MEEGSRTTNWLRIAIGLVLVVAVALGTIYVIDPEILGFPGPGRTILTFVKSYNDKDINLMLTCVDSRIERGVRGVSNILGGLIKVDPKDVFDVIPMVAAIVGNQPGSSQLENPKIVQKSIAGDSASVIAAMDERTTLNQGEKVSHLKVLFKLQHEETGWRINGLQLIQ